MTKVLHGVYTEYKYHVRRSEHIGNILASNMQCFQVGYRELCHASLVFFVSHSKTLNNYFIPCLERAWKFSGIPVNFGNASKPFLRRYYHFRKFSEVFAKVRKLEENFGNS